MEVSLVRTNNSVLPRNWEATIRNPNGTVVFRMTGVSGRVALQKLKEELKRAIQAVEEFEKLGGES